MLPEHSLIAIWPPRLGRFLFCRLLMKGDFTVRTRNVLLLQAAVLAIVTFSEPSIASDRKSQRNHGEASDQERNETDPSAEVRNTSRKANSKTRAHKATLKAANQHSEIHHATAAQLKTGQLTPHDAKRAHAKQTSVSSRTTQSQSHAIQSRSKTRSATTKKKNITPEDSTNDIQLNQHNARTF